MESSTSHTSDGENNAGKTGDVERAELLESVSDSVPAQRQQSTLHSGPGDGDNDDDSSSGGTSESSKMIRRPMRRKRGQQQCCRWLRQFVVRFLKSSPEEYQLAKMYLGFPVGALIAYGFFLAVIEPMDLGADTRRLVGGLFGVGLAAGFAGSTRVRCIVCLLVPTFFGKTGRSYIGTFAISYLILGPVQNIILNGQDITRSLTCSAELSANHSRNKWMFKMQPVGHVIKEMQENGFMLNKLSRKVDKAFEPVKEEIRDRKKMKEQEEQGKVKDGDKVKDEYLPPDEVERRYRKKLNDRCEELYNNAIQRCRDLFNRIYHKCRDDIPVVGEIICFPLKFDFVCNILKFVAGSLGAECNSMDVVNPSFGEVYKTTEESARTMDKGFEVNVQYKVVHTPEDLDYTSAEEMRKGAMHEFKQKRQWLDFCTTLIRRLLGFTFLLVIFNSHKYCSGYLTDVTYDNIYITSYFRRIDARRRKQGKKILLPLKKAEAEGCIFPTSLRMMKSERKKIGKGTLLTVAKVFLAGMIFFTDYLFYKVLDIISRHSRLDFRQTGTNHIDIKVSGSGFMAEIVRVFLNGLNVHHKLDKVSTNEECLPRPTPLEPKYLIYVFGVYGGIWLLMLLEAYGLRLRRLIASFFYRKREKMRVLFTYNTMLTRRKNFLRRMRRKVKRKAKKRRLSERTGILYALRRQFPHLCGWLKCCQRAQSKCLICEDTPQKGFHHCQSFNCNFGYCHECWIDIKKRCFACLPDEEFSTTDSENTSDSGDTS